MGSGVNCDHWRTECTKCGRRYHICYGTSQCESCRKAHFRTDPKTGERVFVFYRDTRHPRESRIDKLDAACNDLRYRGFIGRDLADIEPELRRLRPDLFHASA